MTGVTKGEHTTCKYLLQTNLSIMDTYPVETTVFACNLEFLKEKNSHCSYNQGELQVLKADISCYHSIDST